MTAPPRSVLVALDGSADSEQALEWAAGVAKVLDAEVVAVHVVGLLEHLDDASPEKRLAGWCAPLASDGVKHRMVTVDGSPVPAILEVARREHADMVVVGRRGVGGFPELTLGSTSHQLVQHAPVPVVVVPPP